MEKLNNTFSPGELAISNMKLLKSESSIFKVPKPPRKKNKPSEILEEDLYVQNIGKIIQRDFFPDLEKLNAQNEFLEATENKDYVKLKEITRRYSGKRPPTEPYNSPATFDTPNLNRPSSPIVDEPGGKADDPKATTENRPKNIIDRHSLDSFLASHTSEDNANYDRVISLEDKKKSMKMASQYQSEISSAKLADDALVLPSLEQQADQTNKPLELDTWRFKCKNHIMYVPDGAESQRPGAKPELQHANTRLRADPFDQARNKETITAIARSQEASVSGKISVDGSCSDGRGAEWAPVATPSPRPGAGADESPLMTWGHIEGTPFRLDAGDTPRTPCGAGGAYRMLEAGARERLALQLAERAARRRRPTTPARTPHTPNFRTNTERLASMSPAARKLMTKHLLSPRLKLTPGSLGLASHATTPKSSSALMSPRPKLAAKTAPIPQDTGLTDDLLQINLSKRERLKAQDFFRAKT